MITKNLCNETSEPMTKFQYEMHTALIVSSAINVLLSIVAIVGNIVVLVAIKRSPSLHSPSYVLLFSLAISDLGVGLLVQPLHVLVIIWRAKATDGVPCGCIVARQASSAVFSAVSYLMVTVISIDRFLAVHLRLRYRTVVTMRRTVGAVVFIWAFTGTIIGGTGAGFVNRLRTFYTLSITLVSIVSFIVTTVAFALSIRILRRFQVQPRPSSSDSHRQHIHNGSFNFGRYRRNVYSVLYVYGFFIICYVPMIVYFLLDKFIEDTRSLAVAYEFIVTAVFLNSSINPALYYWRIKDLRQAVNNVWFSGDVISHVRQPEIQMTTEVARANSTVEDIPVVLPN